MLQVSRRPREPGDVMPSRQCHIFKIKMRRWLLVGPRGNGISLDETLRESNLVGAHSARPKTDPIQRPLR